MVMLFKDIERNKPPFIIILLLNYHRANRFVFDYNGSKVQKIIASSANFLPITTFFSSVTGRLKPVGIICLGVLACLKFFFQIWTKVTK